MKKIVLFLLIISGITGIAQDKFVKQEDKIKKFFSIAADCKNAIKINLGKYISYGPTIAPEGFGKVQEIQGSNKKNCFGFEKEHNSAWYYFDVEYSGTLLLDIIPVDSTNDYDFMLFKYTDSSFCDLLALQKIPPVRSNISRSGKGGTSITGLSNLGKENLIHAGPGKTFSKPVEVQKGERYYLVLDNVYPEGLGHTIRLGYQKIAQLSGVILNEENNPVQADVTLEDMQGREVKKTKSDVDGKYNIEAPIWWKSSYTLSFSNDSSFISSKTISTDLLEKTDYAINNIKVVLPKLKGGKKYVLGGINFYGNSPTLLPESNSSVYSLFKLMKKNKKMTIRIEGHVNDPYKAPSLENYKTLSENRAQAVYNILLFKGIEKERMSTIGFGSLYMLFPRAVTEEQNEANRRVEINVLSIK